MSETKVRRAFMQHMPTGEIWAVDVESYDGGPVVIAALRLTRDVELTMGALPVLALDTEIELLKIVQAMYDGREFFPWAPEQTNLQIIHRLHELHEDLRDAQGKTKLASEKLKKAKSNEAEIEQQIFALCATIREDEPVLPFDGPTPAQSVAPEDQAIATPAAVDSESVAGIEAMAAAVEVADGEAALRPADPLFAEDAAFDDNDSDTTEA